MPVMLAIWETDIGRITVQGQPGQKSSPEPIWKNVEGVEGCCTQVSTGVAGSVK
jgi:hypothetical protein